MPGEGEPSWVGVSAAPPRRHCPSLGQFGAEGQIWGFHVVFLPLCLNDYAGPASVYDGDAEAALLKGPSPEPMYAAAVRGELGPAAAGSAPPPTPRPELATAAGGYINGDAAVSDELWLGVSPQDCLGQSWLQSFMCHATAGLGESLPLLPTVGSCPLCFPSGFLHLNTLGYQWPQPASLSVLQHLVGTGAQTWG